MYSLYSSLHWISNVSVYPRMTSYGAVIAKVDGSKDMCYGEYGFVVPGSFNEHEIIEGAPRNASVKN
jgi:hypothetical protein